MKKDRFSHITSRNPARDGDVSQRETTSVGKTRGAPEKERIGRATYDKLLSLLSEEREDSTSPLGVFVANSTKRKIRSQFEGLFQP